MATNITASQRFSTSSQSVVNADGTITQNERLFTNRARYDINKNLGLTGGDRGDRAYIRLMTNDKSASLNRGKADVGFSQATSLTTNDNVLNQAINGDTTKYKGYANFLIQSVRGNLDEKLQVSEVYGDGEVSYYFGRSPIMFSISGTVMDSVDNNWFLQWLEMYAHVLRGTQLARNYELIKLVLPNMELIGTIPHTSWEQRSDNDVLINFEFQFLAKQIIPKPVILSGAALSEEFALINFSAVPEFVSQAALNSLKSYSAKLQNVASSKTEIAAALANVGKGIGGTVSNALGGLGSLGGLAKLGASAASSSGGIGGLFSSVGANLTGIRASLFSPIYGVLSSLTRLIRNGVGDVMSVFNSVAGPIKDILRDVQNISTQATGLVTMVNNAIRGITGQIVAIDNTIANTIASVKNAAGTISSAPITIANSLKNLVSAGRFPLTAGFLQNKPRASLGLGTRPASKIALLQVGRSNTAAQGATI